MSTKISYHEVEKNLSAVFERVADGQEIIIVQNQGNGGNVAIIAESELSSLMETVYLLRSPANAARLHKAIQESRQRQSEELDRSEVIDAATAISQLCEELGIVRQKEG
jgi:antitoxin YefM